MDPLTVMEYGRKASGSTGFRSPSFLVSPTTPMISKNALCGASGTAIKHHELNLLPDRIALAEKLAS